MSDIKPLTDTPFESALARLIYAGEALGEALAREQELEDDRAAIKADAIVRVMKRDGLAATPAEKIVETDEQYFLHRAAQNASIVARFRADAEYHAAQAAATQASLITPSMVELKAKISSLEAQLKTSKSETQVREVALRRANGFLADRIRDVDELTKANRELSARLAVPPRKVDFDTLEQSRDAVFPEPQYASDPRD
jgi:hypothetical protein